MLWLNIGAIDLMIINNTMNCYIYGSSKKKWIYMKHYRKFHLVLEKKKKWTANVRPVFISDVIEIYFRNTYNYCKFTTESVSLIPAHGGMYLWLHWCTCDYIDVLMTTLMYLWHACWFSQGTPVTSTYRTDRHL